MGDKKFPAAEPIPISDSGWLTSKEAAELMGVSQMYIRTRLRQLGLLQPRKVGHMLLWRREDIEEYLLRHPRVGKLRAAS